MILYGTGNSSLNFVHLRELEIENRVIFAGSVNDVAERIKKAGVFVLTSDTEGMPNALIEAMVMGLPVISTDCPVGWFGSPDHNRKKRIAHPCP